MGFSSVKQYFKELCEQNLAIAHVDGTNHKFYTMQIEEFLSAPKVKLPSPDAGPAFILMKYIRSVDYKDRPLDTQQIMFFVLQAVKEGDSASVDAAEDACEQVVEQIIIRMNHDSINGHSLFQRGFDRINGVRVVPFSINANTKYIGWQVSVKNPLQFNCTYNSSFWS